MMTTATTNTIYLLRCTMKIRFVERKYAKTHCHSAAHIYINISYCYSVCLLLFRWEDRTKNGNERGNNTFKMNKITNRLMVWIVCLMSLLLLLFLIHSFTRSLSLSTTISRFLPIFSLCSLPSFPLFHTENARLSTYSMFFSIHRTIEKKSLLLQEFYCFRFRMRNPICTDFFFFHLYFSGCYCCTALHCTALRTAIVCICISVCFFQLSFFILVFFLLPTLSFSDLYDFIFLLVYFVFALYFFAYYSHQPISHQLHFAAR